MVKIQPLRKKFKPVEPFDFLTGSTVQEKKFRARGLEHAETE